MAVTAIIDYDAGNIRSVENALRLLGEETVVTAEAQTILAADHVILPGVGAFGDAMDRLHERGLVPVIHEVTERGIPFLGICLGQQLLFEESEESPGVRGLGLIDGRVRLIPDTPDADGRPRKVPQIGWNSLELPRSGRIFEGVSEGAYVYFVHSYACEAADRSVVTATCEYGITVDASVEKGRIYACQFHPEKSADVGMRILSNFLR